MPLCERHASSRTAPVGWQMLDRRTGARKLEIWSAEDEGRPAPAFAVPTERPSAKRPADPMSRRSEDVEIDEPAAAASEPAVAVPTDRPAARRPKPEPAPTPEPAAKQEPVADQDKGFRWPKQGDEESEDDDKPDKGLAADSPLLSRAFRAAK